MSGTKSGKVLAVIVCVVLIASSIVFGSYKSVNSVRQKALEYFENGDGTQKDLGVAYLLDKKLGQAQNLIIIAERYLNENDESLKALYQAISDMESYSDTESAKKANEALNDACALVEETLQNYDLSVQDQSYLSEIMNNSASYDMQMGHCTYNQAAEEFNTVTLNSIPAGFLARLLGVKQLSLF